MNSRIVASFEPGACHVSSQCLLRFRLVFVGYCWVHRHFSNDMSSHMNIRSRRSSPNTHRTERCKDLGGKFKCMRCGMRSTSRAIAVVSSGWVKSSTRPSKNRAAGTLAGMVYSVSWTRMEDCHCGVENVRVIPESSWDESC